MLRAHVAELQDAVRRGVRHLGRELRGRGQVRLEHRRAHRAGLFNCGFAQSRHLALLERVTLVRDPLRHLLDGKLALLREPTGAISDYATRQLTRRQGRTEKDRKKTTGICPSVLIQTRHMR